MDRSVPLAAALLLDFIRDTEVGTDGPSGYNVIYGFNQDKLPKPITQMTIDEIIGAQADWSKRFGSSATGGYQFMRATLTDLKRELGLRGTQTLDPDLQDRLGFHLLKRRGYNDFMAGKIDRTEFGKRLSQEWASFPVLQAIKGAHRVLVRGQSYYAGDALNKSLVKPEEVEQILDRMRELGEAMPAPAPVADPKPEVAKEEKPVEEKATTPVEQASKAVGAGKGVAQGSGLAGAILVMLVSFGWIPADANTAAVGAAFAFVLTSLSNFIMGVVQTYRAPPNAG